MRKIDVSIIIVSYNTADITCQALQSLRDFLPKEYTFEIIVIDNASKDNSVEKIKKEFKEVTLIENNVNSGFSRANNIGIKKATGRYVLFFNSDAFLRKGTMAYLIQFMDENAKAGACTPYVEIPTGDVDDASHRGFPTPWNSLCHFSGLSKLFPQSMLFNGYHLGWRDLKTKTHEIDALAGAFMFVRREAGEEVGWWDEDYFFYGEDIDFCYSLKEKGWKIYFIPEVSILHLKGMSSGIKEHSKSKSTATKETKIWVTNHRFDAMKTFYKKHYRHKYPVFLQWMILSAVEVKRKYTLRALK